MSRKAQGYVDQGVARCPRCDGVMSIRMRHAGPYFHCLCYGATGLALPAPPGPARERDGRADYLAAASGQNKGLFTFRAPGDRET